MHFCKKILFFYLVLFWSFFSYGSSHVDSTHFERELEASVEEFLRALAEEEHPYLAVDTEFFCNKKGEPPFLSLIQLKGPGGLLAVIDLLDGKGKPVSFRQLSSLKKLFLDEKIVKLFHDGRQDLNLLKKVLKVSVIPNCIDTQVLCSFCSDRFFEAGAKYRKVAYSLLVETLLGVELDKTQQKSRWGSRPLTLEQLNYASGDVIYLYAVYPYLCELLQEKGALWAHCAFQAASKSEEEAFPAEGVIVCEDWEDDVDSLRASLNPVSNRLGVVRSAFLRNKELQIMVMRGLSYEDLRGWRKLFYACFMSDLLSAFEDDK